MKVVLLSCDDWEAIYVNGVHVCGDHSGITERWLYSCAFPVCIESFIHKGLNQVAADRCSWLGRMPLDLEEADEWEARDEAEGL